MKTSIKHLLAILITFSSTTSFASSCDDLINKLEKSMKTPSSLQILLPEITKLEISCSNPQEAEKQILKALWELENAKKLEASVLLLVKTIKKENKIPALNSISEELAVETLTLAIRSELYDRGYYTKSFIFPGWQAITDFQEKLLKSLPTVSSFKSENFKKVFWQLTGMPMTSMAHVEVLNSNAKAFEKRIEIVKLAKSSVKLATWGFYDDASGKRFANELIAAVKRNVKVQILVDHNVSQRSGYSAELTRMRRAGVEVLGWKSNLNPFYGMHSKMLIVDDLTCIEGGRNIGDFYLKNNQWSDLDVYFEGPIAEVINPNIFANLWNEQLGIQRLSYKKIPLKKTTHMPSGETGTFISSPQLKISDTASNVTVYSIMNARREIDIANAYFISTPGIKKALFAAMKRGVRVRILSNSMTSVDEPIVSIPIQKSLKEMYEKGAEIYLKSGQTLHTKIFKVDELSWFGSYNLHPRSGRYEVEKLIVTTDSQLTRELDRSFEMSLRQGKRVMRVSELSSPEHVGMDLLFSAIFNQL